MFVRAARLKIIIIIIIIIITIIIIIINTARQSGRQSGSLSPTLSAAKQGGAPRSHHSRDFACGAPAEA